MRQRDNDWDISVTGKRLESSDRSTTSRRVTIGVGAVSLTVFAMVLSTVWTSFCNSDDQLLALGIQFLDRERYGDAWEIANRLRSRKASSPIVLRFIVDSALKARQAVELPVALASLSKVAPLAAGKEWIRLASSEMTANRLNPAEVALEQALLCCPDSTEALRLKAQLAGVLGRSSELLDCLFKLVKLRSFKRNDLVMLATSDPFVSDPSRTDSLLRVSPDDPRPLLASALVASNDNQLVLATTLLRQVVAQSPNDWPAQAKLGLLLTDQSRDTFLAWHTQIPPAAETYARLWMVRGQWLKSQGALKSAARCYWEAIKREPELMMAMTQLGQTLRLSGEVSIGEEFIHRGRLLQEISDLATRIHEQNQFSWCPALVTNLERAGRLWEAWAWCSIHAETQPNNSSVAARQNELAARLSADLPRTIPESVPGRNLDWSLVALPDWSQYTPRATESSELPLDSSIWFEDQAERTGLVFNFISSDDPSVPGRMIFESTGAGVAAIDFDKDGWTDLYFPQAGPWPVVAEKAPLDSLFRNVGGKSFVEVTRQASLFETSYSQGVAAGDFDNDGFPDLYVANIGQNRLYCNNGDGTFRDITESCGLKDELWTVSCAIADLNLDGFPELFDVNYLNMDRIVSTVCFNNHNQPGVCRPTMFDPALDSVALNQGDGTFVALKDEVGLNLAHGMGLGLVIGHFDDDGRPDIFVANDQTPNYLLINETSHDHRDIQFSEQGLILGVGLDRDGFALACMGVASGDVNRDGRLDLFVTNFANESNTLYLSQPDGSFADQTREAGLRDPSFALLGFGTQFLDADRDGLLDLIVLNGHIDDFFVEGQEFEMRPQLFQGTSTGRFRERFASEAGEFFAKKRLGRGLALLDWNRDGLIDFIGSYLEGLPVLGTNRTKNPGNGFVLRCIGTVSSRDAVGLKAVVTTGNNERWTYQITAGDGYESSSERAIHVSLGEFDVAEQIELYWPSGRTSQFHNIASDHVWIAIEGASMLIPEIRETDRNP